MSVFSHNRRQRWVAAIAASSLAFLVAACGEGTGVGSAPPARSAAPGEPVYTAIIDAGSSGTRINFYKVIPGPYPTIQMLESQEFKDNGINDFLQSKGTINPARWARTGSTLPAGYKPDDCSMTLESKTGGQADVGPCVIRPLLDSLKSKMDTNKISPDKVVVELFATAGMRTMAKFFGGAYGDQEIAAFYDTMKTYAKNKGFGVGEFRTSNGNKEEGVWTWVNLNDQYYNAFGGNTTYHTGTPETRGDFEVGGSSMQVAFPTTAIPVGDANNVYPVTINGKTYNVFSKTYLGLGGDDARKFVRSYGYSNPATAGYSGLDCFGSNANAANSKEDSGIALFHAPKIFPNVAAPEGNAKNTTWPTVLSNEEAPLVLSGNGRYNFKSCAAKYNEVTQAVMTLPRNSNGTEYGGSVSSYADLAAKVAKSDAPFVGLDGFWFSSSDLGLVPKGEIKTPLTETQVLAAIAKTCPDNGTGPAPKDPPELNNFRVCADSAYMYNFLWRDKAGVGGLFDPNSKAKFDGVVPSKINKQAVLTWSRGYLLLKYSK